MVEIGIAEYFSMAGALGIISSMFVVRYFSRKQMKILSADIETKILNDIDERMREITQIGVERPELIKVISNISANYSSPEVLLLIIFYTHMHVYSICGKRSIKRYRMDRWLRYMKSAF
jgi:hypothetical protein